MISSGYAGLALSAFLAATLIPASSEVVLSSLLVSGEFDRGLLLGVASTANTLGSVVNWLLGRFCLRWRDRPWFPVKADALDRASQWFGKWGVWSLLLSWVPVIGDPLTLAAGVLKVDFLRFLALVAVAKTTRYAVLLGLLDWMVG